MKCNVALIVRELIYNLFDLGFSAKKKKTTAEVRLILASSSFRHRPMSLLLAGGSICLIK